MLINIFLGNVVESSTQPAAYRPGDTATHPCQPTAQQQHIMFCQTRRAGRPPRASDKKESIFFNGFSATFLDLAPRLLTRSAWNPDQSPCVRMPVVLPNFLKNLFLAAPHHHLRLTLLAAGQEISPCGENLDNQILPYGKRYWKSVRIFVFF